MGAINTPPHRREFVLPNKQKIYNVVSAHLQGPRIFFREAMQLSLHARPEDCLAAKPCYSSALVWGCCNCEGEVMRLGESLIAVLVLVSCLGAQENKSTRLSPPGTAELTLNGKKLSVAYSRPKIRDPKTSQQLKLAAEYQNYARKRERDTVATEIEHI